MRIIILQINLSEVFQIARKDFEGNKIVGTEFQRAAGRCEAVLNLVCIAHPGVAGLMIS